MPVIDTDRPSFPAASGDELQFRSILEHAGELARLLLKSPQPPRQLTSEFLHSRKRFSTETRGYISSLAYHALRCWRPATALITGEHADVATRMDRATAPAVCAAALHLALVPDARYPLPQELRDCPWSMEAIERVTRALMGSTDITRYQSHLGTDASLPDWVVSALRQRGMPDEAILRTGRELCAPSPLILRVNIARISRKTLIHTLRDADIGASVHPRLPAAVVIENRVSLLESSWYGDGLFEVQDAGSQLIAYACGAGPGTNVLDACAGGGGKTMHLLDLTQDSGKLLACDIERSKLRGLRQRAARVSSTTLETLALTPAGVPQLSHDNAPEEGAFDCVLVDAPCSGFGTVRRNPALKWRLKERTVQRLSHRQLDILSRNAEYVRPGGALVYATCSLLPAENDDVVDAFLDRNPGFVSDPLLPVFSSHGLVLDELAPDACRLTVFPSLLDSDGYFMARFRRV
jgi:16S rRNA (cytosine967-C5)-methyltransferase